MAEISADAEATRRERREQESFMMLSFKKMKVALTRTLKNDRSIYVYKVYIRMTRAIDMHMHWLARDRLVHLFYLFKTTTFYY